MAIQFHQTSKEFHLYNEQISYIIKVLENGQLGHVYFGKHLTDREDFGYLVEYATRDMAPYPFEGRSNFSLEHLKQEYPTFGSGDTRYPAFELESADGSRVADFKYKTHEIYSGKKGIQGLPAVYVEDDSEADTLEIVLEDTFLKTEIVLSYTIFNGRPVITRHARFACGNENGITLLNCMSGCLDLPDKEYEMVELAGTWNRERHPHTRKLCYGTQGVYSMRGCSSHQFNPFLMLKRKEADEFSGELGSVLSTVEIFLRRSRSTTST